MKITLQTLSEIDACAEARRAFVETFGEAGSPTALQVFRAIAKGKRHDWLFWLAGRLSGFVAAVGNRDEGEFHCAASGELEIRSGYMICSGSATVRASGSATVRASDSATVEASDSATVRAYGSATVEASDSATVRAYGSATVRASDSATVEASGSATVEASDSATVRAYGSATVEASDSATVRAYGSATVRASDSATVRAYGSATVEAYDSATVLLTKHSLSVSFSLKSELACAVDRRNGKPQLVLAEPEPATEEPHK